MEECHNIKYETGGLGALCNVVVHEVKLSQNKLLEKD